MQPHHDYDLIVAGAGMVGMSTALWAQSEGLRVAICDPNPAGSGTTSGSACVIATYACNPVNSPSIFKSLPSLLASPDSPLNFNLLHGLKNPAWMLSFLNNCRPARVDHIANALAGLLAHTDDGLNPLIALADAQDLIIENDCLYVWSSASGHTASLPSEARRARLGVQSDDLSPSDILTLEPNIRLPLHRGRRFKGVRHITSPQELVLRMHRKFTSLGGTTLPHKVVSSNADVDGVTAQLNDDTQIRAPRLVIAAGARSRDVKGSGADKLPLGTERGYHILYENHRDLLSRPVGWAEAGFYATPMADGLRVAGTVEINAIDAPFNTKSTAYLKRKSHNMFGNLGPPDSEWLGHRPTMPDSLPVIGPSNTSDRIIMAFGHQHIGLTLGGITGKIATDLAQGRKPSCDITAFSAGRF
ncbi:FAD-binding oxidoreductase [Octadecabacter sp. 1_MG-2023]|uniref:NAD(P)/FAD-dependent oxidoreductase n=1 Tax=unclassified Octadecabacter TaxID=196158 RepID=UPI001C09DB5C|nr:MULTISPECIES: FAD-binding oxidoreductase [unclassified Octadecabacter]MBU2993970.1 FAD-binding oxidoreductase [Octadecabacter sp. B2R22]MDO6735184.1 FAD-binding oxidoreductase [Octadecabacter sp. 1_MG-2023]